MAVLRIQTPGTWHQGPHRAAGKKHTTPTNQADRILRREVRIDLLYIRGFKFLVRGVSVGRGGKVRAEWSLGGWRRLRGLTRILKKIIIAKTANKEKERPLRKVQKRVGGNGWSVMKNRGAGRGWGGGIGGGE